MVLWLIFAGCANDEAFTNGGDETEVVDTDSDTPEDAPTYYADVKPLLAQHCTRCHNSDGLGVGDFTDVDQVTLLASAIQACLLYTSPSPRDRTRSRMPSSA